MKFVSLYISGMKISRSNLFELFSILFGGSFPISKSGNLFLLICFEQVACQLIVEATATAMVEIV